MKGRKPVPTALRLLRGNPSRRPLPTNEPAPKRLAKTPPPPSWLNEAGAAEWRRLAPMLIRLGIVTETDTAALAAYCEAFAVWIAATHELHTGGLVLEGKTGPRVSPYVKIANAALSQVRALLVEFGLTPSSRVRLRVPPAADPPARASKWAGLL